MKIETQILEDHQVKLKVEIEPEPLDVAKRKAARKIAQKAKIPGFRPGKAPFHIVERFVGEEALLQDALDILINEVYPKAIEESGIKPYGMGKLDNIPSTNPPIFEFVVPLEAEVTLGDYRSLRIPFEPKQVSEEEVASELEDLREHQAIIEPVDRPAQYGDQVTVRISAERKQDEEGNKVTLIRERSLPFILKSSEGDDGSDSGEEWPFKGFSQHLVGLSADDTKSLSYTFPEDSSFAAWRGEEAEFNITVENVKSRTLPTLDDDFAHSQGDFENLEALNNSIRTTLEGQSRQTYEAEYNDKILDALVEQTQFKYPPQMVEDEIDSLVNRLENQLARQNLSMDVYLKMRQMDRQALRDEFKPSAESRVKRYLAIYEIAEKEKIEVSPEEVESETSRTITQLYESLPPDTPRRELSEQTVSNLANNIVVDLMVQKTLTMLRETAQGKLNAKDSQSSETGSEPEPVGVSDPGIATQAEEQESEIQPATQETPNEGDEDIHSTSQES